MQRAASMPFRPGMCTSRNTTCGCVRSNSSTASRPLRAWATTCSSGHRPRQHAWRRRSRSSGSSSAISAVGHRRFMRARSTRIVGAQAVRRLLRSARRARRRRRRRRSRARRLASPVPGAARARTGRRRCPPPRAAPSPRRIAPRADLDAAALARSGRCRGGSRSPPASAAPSAESAARAAPGSMSTANASRSGMRICISSR